MTTSVRIRSNMAGQLKVLIHSFVKGIEVGEAG